MKKIICLFIAVLGYLPIVFGQELLPLKWPRISDTSSIGYLAMLKKFPKDLTIDTTYAGFSDAVLKMVLPDQPKLMCVKAVYYDDSEQTGIIARCIRYPGMRLVIFSQSFSWDKAGKVSYEKLIKVCSLFYMTDYEDKNKLIECYINQTGKVSRVETEKKIDPAGKEALVISDSLLRKLREKHVTVQSSGIPMISDKDSIVLRYQSELDSIYLYLQRL